MKKYDLWWLNSRKEWVVLNQQPESYDNIIKFLKKQTELTLSSSIKPSIFKISEVNDNKWFKQIPEYLLERENG